MFLASRSKITASTNSKSKSHGDAPKFGVSFVNSVAKSTYTEQVWRVMSQKHRRFKKMADGSLRRFYTIYVAYLLVVIFVSSFCLVALESREDLPWVDCFFLAVSASTMTGLSTVDFSARPAKTHVVILLSIIAGGPILLSLIPVVFRWLHSDDSHDRRGVAFFGLATTPATEGKALRFLIIAVTIYWFSVQALGSFLLWLSFKSEGSPLAGTEAVFLSISAFHNAGLVSAKQGLSLSIVPSVPTLMFLILAGNTCFPVFLHVFLKVVYKSIRDSDRRCVLKLLLTYPRTCYTHLFSGHVTISLAALTLFLISIQVAAFVFIDYTIRVSDQEDIAFLSGLTGWRYALAVCFLSVSTRTAGFNFGETGLNRLGPANAIVFCASMWISACPVVATMRSTYTKINSAPLTGMRQWGRAKKDLREQASNFMTQDTPILALSFFVIVLAEEASHNYRESTFMFIVFEFCSSYGTVGLSMGKDAWSEVGNWHAVSKCALMVVMFVGRLRGLPTSIEPTVSFWEERVCEDQLDADALPVPSQSASEFPIKMASTSTEGIIVCPSVAFEESVETFSLQKQPHLVHL